MLKRCHGTADISASFRERFYHSLLPSLTLLRRQRREKFPHKKKKRKTKEEELLRIPLRTSNNAPIQLAAQRVDVVFVIFLVVIGNLNTAHSYQIGFNVHTLYEKTPNVLSHTAIQRRPRNGDKKKMNPKPRKKKKKRTVLYTFTALANYSLQKGEKRKNGTTPPLTLHIYIYGTPHQPENQGAF